MNIEDLIIALKNEISIRDADEVKSTHTTVLLEESLSVVKRCSEIDRVFSEVFSHGDQAQRAFMELARDKERLDWIERNRVQLNCSMGAPGVFHYQVGRHPGHSSYRAAIDARIAMKLSIDR